MSLADLGIEITKNDFVSDGVCRYRDVFGNTVFARRTDDGFVAKLRFVDKDVKAKPLYVSVPVKEGEDGGTLRLDYPSQKTLESADIQGGISAFTTIVQYWINMLLDIKLLQISPELIIQMDENINSVDDVGKRKMAALYEYEELREVVEHVMSLKSDSLISHT